MWNVVDLAITLLSITTMGLYFARLVFINLAIGQFRSDRTIFVSFQYVVLLNEILNSMIAIAVLLLSLKFLRILRFNRKISMLSSTMRACIKIPVLFHDHVHDNLPVVLHCGLSCIWHSSGSVSHLDTLNCCNV